MEGAFRLHHHPPDAPAGHQPRLEPRALHYGRRPVEGRHRGVRAPVSRGTDLPWQAPGQLGPGAADRSVRSRGGEPGGGRLHLGDQLSAGRRHRFPHRRHHAPGNPARRHRGRRASRGRTLPAPDRQAGAPARRRAQHSGHRRRLRRSRIRHRRGEDHPRARFQRLAGRPAPRPRRQQRAHARREDERSLPRRIPGPRPLRCAPEAARRAAGQGPAGVGQGAQADDSARRPHARGDRAHAHRPMVHEHGRPGPACARRGRQR